MQTTSLSKIIDLHGKVAVVTGGGRGIGRGIALRLAEAGAAILVADINNVAAQETADLIKSVNGNAAAFEIDARSVADAREAMEAAVSLFGDLDILVNNAAVITPSPILEITETQWDMVLDTNLKGVFLCSGAAAKKMIEKGHGGKIINISSFSWTLPSGYLGHYDASKGGIVSLTKSFAKELGEFGI